MPFEMLSLWPTLHTQLGEGGGGGGGGGWRHRRAGQHRDVLSNSVPCMGERSVILEHHTNNARRLQVSK